MIKEIIIYSNHKVIFYDYVHRLKRLFEEIGFKGKICQSDTLDAKKWNVNSTLVVIPAGDAKKLELPKELATFVNAGGSLLTVCGSAYSTCQHRDWNNRVNTSALSFFKGVARGPLCKGNQMVEVEGGKVLVNFGGYLIPNPLDEYPHEVLMKYKAGGNAVVKSYVGKGIVIFCMPHFEFSDQDVHVEIFSRYFPGSNWTQIQKTLTEQNAFRTKTFTRIFSEFAKKRVVSKPLKNDVAL